MVSTVFFHYIVKKNKIFLDKIMMTKVFNFKTEILSKLYIIKY